MKPASDVRQGPGAGIRELAEFILDHRPLVVLTGAGCSTASGIPDYRDASGNWKFARPTLYEDFIRHHPVRQQYWARSIPGWTRMASATPNRIHHALARLETAGLVNCIITQNVDGLHQRAGSKSVLELHGNLHTVICIECGQSCRRAELQSVLLRRNPALKQHVAAFAPDGDALTEDHHVTNFQVPACSHCNGILKPDVVFFGENVPRARVAAARSQLEKAAGMLIIGSSLMVYSGYRFCRTATTWGIPMAAVNLGKTRADQELQFKLKAQAGPVLAAVLNVIDSRMPPANRFEAFKIN